MREKKRNTEEDKMKKKKKMNTVCKKLIESKRSNLRYKKIKKNEVKSLTNTKGDSTKNTYYQMQRKISNLYGNP